MMTREAIFWRSFTWKFIEIFKSLNRRDKFNGAWRLYRPWFAIRRGRWNGHTLAGNCSWVEYKCGFSGEGLENIKLRVEARLDCGYWRGKWWNEPKGVDDEGFKRAWVCEYRGIRAQIWKKSDGMLIYTHLRWIRAVNVVALAGVKKRLLRRLRWVESE